MRVAVFNTKPYDREFLTAANAAGRHEVTFLEPNLTAATAKLADGYEAVCVFVNDVLNAGVLQTLWAGGVRLIALRCAGFNNVDLKTCAELGMKVIRVPAYSPYAVAEHTVGLMLALNRKLHKAYNRVREGNFSLDGLLGFDFHGRTFGVVGTGQIGVCTARILSGFGGVLLGYDVRENPEFTKLGGRYASLDEVLASSDVVSLHCPLTKETHHLINAERLAAMRSGVMLINTGRGALVDTPAVVQALKSGKLGSLGIDVYEEEANLFFRDLSSKPILDDVFSRLLTFPNVLITGHQAFFTREALTSIATQTFTGLDEFAAGKQLTNQVPTA